MHRSFLQQRQGADGERCHAIIHDGYSSPYSPSGLYAPGARLSGVTAATPERFRDAVLSAAARTTVSIRDRPTCARPGVPALSRTAPPAAGYRQAEWRESGG